VYFVLSATAIVTVADPFFLPVIVTFFPLTEAVQTDVSLLVAVIAPSLFVVTVIVVLGVEVLSVADVADSDIVPVALAAVIVNVAVVAL